MTRPAAALAAMVVTLGCVGCHLQQTDSPYKVDTVGDVGMTSWSLKFHDTGHVCAAVVHLHSNKVGDLPDWEVSTYFPDTATKIYRLPTFTSADYLADEYCHGFIKPF